MLNYETGKATHLQRFRLGNNRVIPAMIVLVDYLWCSPKRGNGRAGRRVPFVTSTPQTICLRAPKIIQYTATKSRAQCSRVASIITTRMGPGHTPHPFQLCPIATSIKIISGHPYGSRDKDCKLPSWVITVYGTTEFLPTRGVIQRPQFPNQGYCCGLIGKHAKQELNKWIAKTQSCKSVYLGKQLNTVMYASSLVQKLPSSQPCSTMM